MTNPLISILNSAIEREAMTEERIDRLEGYCDGVAGRLWQSRTLYAKAYFEGWHDGQGDLNMTLQVAEWKRRAALPEPAQ